MTAFGWPEVLGIAAEACAAGDARRVLLVLADRAYHVREVLARDARIEQGLLGFIVYRDDPDLAQRSEETSLLFVRPEQVLRLEVLGFDPAEGRRLGFGR